MTERQHPKIGGWLIVRLFVRSVCLFVCLFLFLFGRFPFVFVCLSGYVSD